MTTRAIAVFERELALYRRLWRASVFTAFVVPVLFLLSIGLGVGKYVGHIQGVTYVDWIVPGVVATTVFQIALGESTYPVLGDFKWVRAFHAMRATPVGCGDIIVGRLLSILVRVELSTIAFMIVISGFGVFHSPWVLVIPLVSALLALAVAAPVTAFAATIEQDSYFALLFRFIMIPSSLFAGVFFPVERLPAGVRFLAYLSPLWHAVALDRAASLGTAPPWPVYLHVGYLLLFVGGGFYLALRAFRKKLES